MGCRVMGHLRPAIANFRVGKGHIMATVGHLWVTIGHLLFMVATFR